MADSKTDCRAVAKGRSTITEHLNNIFSEGELEEDSVCREFRHTGSDGKYYNTKFYNLDAIISVGYRVNSKRATQFRQWATQVLKEFAMKGFVLDNKRLENGAFLTEERAKRKNPMPMEDWVKRLDLFLEFDGHDILQGSGKITAKIAKDYADDVFYCLAFFRLISE
jgi:hypothetical protein